MPAPLPAAARCVVIGGGVGGTSIAHHLARLGWRDVVVLEQHGLGEGTTWHSAGFVGVLRSTVTQTRMLMYSSALYDELAAETGRDAGWRNVGGIRVATTPERVEELRRQADTATTYGLELELLSPGEAQERLPLLAVDDVLAASWLPADGYLDPELLCDALAEGARRGGVAFHEHTRVTAIDVAEGRVTGVQTEHGPIAAEVVVIAAGAASRVVGELAGVVIPVVPIRHQYVVTGPVAGAGPEAPTLRDPDHITYLRPEAGGGLLVGGYARAPATWETGRPLAEPRTLFAPDPERFAESWAGAVRRVPALREAEVVRTVNGPEAFTPDGEFVLGETEVGGLWTACGFCVHGLAGAGGVGKVLAEWIVDGRPEYDVATMDIRRFGGQHRSRAHVRERALDAYARYYDVVVPHAERPAGRPLRTSAAWGRLDALGAAWGEKSGWERANWVGANAAAGDAGLRPRGWAGRHWSPAIAAEALATRDAVVLYDQSSFAKLDVSGPGAAAALDRLCAGPVAGEVGRAVYTQLLNAAGGIEADLTVTRTGEQAFRLVTGTASGRRDAALVRRGLPPGTRVEDVTGARACLCLWGPAARELLQPLCDEDLGAQAFGFLRARELSVGPVPVLAQRITFVGELGWELYCPTEYGAALWDLLWAAGRPHGLLAGGYRAIDSLRLEKGYRVWGAEVTPETTPAAAGVAFAVRMDKPGGFTGREALVAEREAGGPARRLRCLVLEDPRAVCLGNEPVRVEGEPVGRVTSGGYGFRVGQSIAYASLPAGVGEGARVDVGLFGERVGAVVAPEPRYDPAGARVRS